MNLMSRTTFYDCINNQQHRGYASCHARTTWRFLAFGIHRALAFDDLFLHSASASFILRFLFFRLFWKTLRGQVRIWDGWRTGVDDSGRRNESHIGGKRGEEKNHGNGNRREGGGVKVSHFWCALRALVFWLGCFALLHRIGGIFAVLDCVQGSEP
jgi:hypothetical protein